MTTQMYIADAEFHTHAMFSYSDHIITEDTCFLKL